jgi:dsDNA-binding SOS-regulon protein
MAVITKFFVVRNGKELPEVFTEKKMAEAYDKALDAAEQLEVLIRQAQLPEKLSDDTISRISICLAKNAPEVTKILKGVKPVPSSPADTDVPKESISLSPTESKIATDKKSAIRPAKPKAKAKAKANK